MYDAYKNIQLSKQGNGDLIKYQKEMLEIKDLVTEMKAGLAFRTGDDGTQW